MKTLHVSLAALLLGSALHAAPGVDELIEMALVRSPDVNVSRLDFDAASQRVKTAKSYYLPSLDAGAAAGYGGYKIKGGDFENDTILSGTLRATQLIYDFGRTDSAIDAATFDANASLSTLNQVVSNKIFEVKQAYYTLVRTRSLSAVYKENVELSERQLYRAQRYFEAGIRTRIDVSDARVKLIDAELKLQNNGYDLKLDRANLEKSIGIRSGETLDEPYYAPLALPYVYKTLSEPKYTLSAAETFALSHRYELQAYREQVEKARANVRSVTADYYPALYANGDYQIQNVNDKALLQSEQQWSTTLGLNWNLFAGGRTDAQSEEARIALMRAQALLESAELSIKQEIDQAYIGLYRSKDAVKLNESLAVAAAEKHLQAQKRYENGLSDFIELQEARQNYIDALASLVRAYYDYYIAKAQLERAMGA